MNSSNPYFDKNEEILQRMGHLPHWNQTQKLYAVTFRLCDSLPKNVIEAFMQESILKFSNNSADFQTKREAYFYKKMMDYMDAGYGKCILKDKAVRKIVEQGFEYMNNTSACMHAYVVMPNHVHAVIETKCNEDLHDIIRNFKRYTACQINHLLNRKGHVWQSEYYDRIIRNYRHYENAINYIIHNPCHCASTDYTLWLNPNI